MAKLIEMINIKKIYRPDKEPAVVALNGLDLSVDEGEWVSVCGVSGSGKSTLLHILGCLDRASEGEYILLGEDTQAYSVKKQALIRREKIGFILQDFGLIPQETAFNNVSLPMLFSRETEKDFKKRTVSALERMQVGDLAARKVSQMSGGQKQRVAIARAIVYDAPLLLADEPTGSLDSKTKHEILSVFKDLHRAGKTIIMVTHDTEAAKLADRVVQLKDGMIHV